MLLFMNNVASSLRSKDCYCVVELLVRILVHQFSVVSNCYVSASHIHTHIGLHLQNLQYYVLLFAKGYSIVVLSLLCDTAGRSVARQ